MSNLPIKRISIHATDTQEGRPLDLKALEKWHRARNFGGIGYHYVIGLEGDIHLTRAIERVPCVVKGHNVGTIGIAYWGGMDHHGKAKDTRTDKQKAALANLVHLLAHRYGIAATSVQGHRDLDYIDKNHDGRAEPNEWLKVCPCFEVSKERDAWLKTGKPA
jgi:N-acetylmuramoyl-L-alanine amidase